MCTGEVDQFHGLQRTELGSCRIANFSFIPCKGVISTESPHPAINTSAGHELPTAKGVQAGPGCPSVREAEGKRLMEVLLKVPASDRLLIFIMIVILPNYRTIAAMTLCACIHF